MNLLYSPPNGGLLGIFFSLVLVFTAVFMNLPPAEPDNVSLAKSIIKRWIPILTAGVILFGTSFHLLELEHAIDNHALSSPSPFPHSTWWYFGGCVVAAALLLAALAGVAARKGAAVFSLVTAAVLATLTVTAQVLHYIIFEDSAVLLVTVLWGMTLLSVGLSMALTLIQATAPNAQPTSSGQ